MGIPDFFALSPWKNPPAVERIMSLIWELQDACEEQCWRDHWHEDEPNCPCVFCEHSHGLWHYLRLIEAVFEGQIYSFPDMMRRRAARSREANTPRDLAYAAKMEARADELEREAGPPTDGQTTADAPLSVCLNALRRQAGVFPGQR